MRTKSILAAAAIIAAGAASSQAQSNVYSLNVVGYVNVVCSNGYTLISTPLVPANAQISALLPDNQNGGTIPAGASVFTFNGSFVGNFNDEFGGGWSAPTATLSNGAAYFMQNNSGSPFTVTFVGEVPQGTLTTPLNPGYNLVGSKVPQAGFIGDLGLTSTDGDFVYKFKNGGFAGYFKDEFGGGWTSSQADVSNLKGPNLNVAEGMFYFRTDIAGAPTWNRNFTVQ